MRLFLVRHGETDENLAGRFQGQRDIPLNETGLKQADLTASRFRNFPLQAVIASPLKRAAVTGQKIRDLAQCNVFITYDTLKEICHGHWEGLSTDEVYLRYRHEFMTWTTNPAEITMPGENGESLEDVRRRTVDTIEKIKNTMAGNVLIASHGAVIKTALCHYLGMPLNNFNRLKIPNCSISIINFSTPHTCEIPLIGDISHLGGGFDSPTQKNL